MSEARPSGDAAADQRVPALLALVLDRNPFQNARLSAHGLGAGAPLEAIPPIAKPDLVEDQRAHPPFGTNLTFPLERYTQLFQTSGTAGPPLKVLDTAEDWRWWCHGFARTYRAAGIGPGDRVALAFSFGPQVHFWAAKGGVEELGAMAVPLGGMTSVQRLHTLADVRATALSCTPTYGLRLLEVAAAQGLEGALAGIRHVFCTGEPGASLPAVRARLEDGFGARVLDHAGLTETGPLAYPCPEGGGMHLDEDEFVCEILDEALRPVGDGATGELVVTAPRRAGFPVLRYRTGDLVLRTAARCPAGHPHRWLPTGIVGRRDDMVVIRGMNVYPSAIEDAVRRVPGAGEFRITFSTEPDGMDEIKLEVELAEAAGVRRLQEIMRHQLGLRVRIAPVMPGMLPRVEHKARRVFDTRSRGGRHAGATPS